MLQVVHADDVAHAVSRLVTSPVPGPFNLAAADVLGPPEVAAPLGGRALRLPQAAVIRAAEVAWEARLWPLDPGWLRMAAEVPLVVCDRARTELGWRPRMSAAETWRELVEGMAAGAGGPTPALRRRTVRDDLVQLLRGGPVTRRRRT